eukprot:COSAG01_NODE_1756_length_9317_cov_14.878607_7_plen_283_part_00
MRRAVGCGPLLGFGLLCVVMWCTIWCNYVTCTDFYNAGAGSLHAAVAPVLRKFGPALVELVGDPNSGPVARWHHGYRALSNAAGPQPPHDQQQQLAPRRRRGGCLAFGEIIFDCFGDGWSSNAWRRCSSDQSSSKFPSASSSRFLTPSAGASSVVCHRASCPAYLVVSACAGPMSGLARAAATTSRSRSTAPRRSPSSSLSRSAAPPRRRHAVVRERGGRGAEQRRRGAGERLPAARSVWRGGAATGWARAGSTPSRRPQAERGRAGARNEPGAAHRGPTGC